MSPCIPLRRLSARRGEARRLGGKLGTHHSQAIPSRSLDVNLVAVMTRPMPACVPSAVVPPDVFMSTLAQGNVVMMRGRGMEGTGCPLERVKPSVSLGAARQASAASEEGPEIEVRTNVAEIDAVGGASGGGGADKVDVGYVDACVMVTRVSGGIDAYFGPLDGIGVHGGAEGGEDSTEDTATDGMRSRRARSAGEESGA